MDKFTKKIDKQNDNLFLHGKLRLNSRIMSLIKGDSGILSDIIEVSENTGHSKDLTSLSELLDVNVFKSHRMLLRGSGLEMS